MREAFANCTPCTGGHALMAQKLISSSSRGCSLYQGFGSDRLLLALHAMFSPLIKSAQVGAGLYFGRVLSLSSLFFSFFFFSSLHILSAGCVEGALMRQLDHLCGGKKAPKYYWVGKSCG